MLISIIFCVLTIYPSFALNKDCIVTDYYKKENWNGKELTFYSYVPKIGSVQIIINYEDLNELDFDTRLILSPSSNYSKRFEKRNGTFFPYRLPTLNTSNEWIKFKLSANKGIIEVTCEPNTNEKVSINQASHKVKDLSIKALNMSVCKEESPTWEITEGIHNKIPLSGKENVNIAIESFEEFSPILHIEGNSVSFSWKKESIAIAKGPSLPKGKYFISIFDKSDQIVLTLYSEKCESWVSLTNIGGHLDSLDISTSNGKFYSILNLDDSTNYYRCEEMNTENGDAVLSLTNFREPVQELDIPMRCLTVYAILITVLVIVMVIVMIVYYILKNKTNILKQNIDLEQQQPLINSEDHESRGKVDKKEIIENFSYLTEPKHSFIKKYKLEMREDHRDSEKKVQKLSLGPIDPYLTTKTILILGETGTGKSTTINTMVNHIFGIELEDAERFILIENETEGKYDKFESQTDFMTAYVFPYKNGMPNHCNYIIIDTPGFGDTRGFERDQKIMFQVENFLKQDYNISHIDVVGFVVKSSAPRLTIAQRYIYDGLFSMFGQDISHNIFLLVTFSEEEDPAVLRILKDADIKYNDYFKLNNDSLYIPYTEDETMEQDFNQPEMIKFNWKLSEKSLQKLFRKTATINPVSLSLTKVVLEENTRLRSIVGYLQKQIKEGLNKMTQLKSKQIESVRPEETKLIEQEISHTEELLVISIKEAQQLSERLKEIPLRLDPLSVHGYIELLIGNEMKEMHTNYEERIQILEKLKEENDVLKVVMNKELSPGEGWLNYFQKLKEE